MQEMSNKKKKKRIHTPQCPYCGGRAVISDGTVIYGRSYGRVWICPNYPECDSYVGCHPGSRRPLGRMANKELRALKIQVHKAFDGLWKSRMMKRSEAYKWLADAMKIPQRECHVGMFDEDSCRAALAACESAPVADRACR